MSKPQRCRRICQKPKYINFLSNENKNAETIHPSTHEYEVIRLVDYEKVRFKLANYLVHGQQLVIKGGNYRLCDGSACCGKPCILQHLTIINKGEHTMRIAVTYENEQIFQHFGHTKQFKLYDIDNGNIISSQVVDTNGSGHGALANFLSFHKVDLLICGGIGAGAQKALADANIQLFGGVNGNVDVAVSKYLNGSLLFNPSIQCNHHDHGEHSCGDHDCGEHHCH